MSRRPGRAGRGGRLAVAALVLLLACTVPLQYAIDGTRTAGAGWDESSPFDSARSVLDLLGGVRQSVAANLWTKTDVVFHEYLRDIGNEQALFPYYWLITRLDPHFTMAYYYASWMLARMGRVDEGFELAVEGLRYNPHSAQLQENLAQLYFFFRRDPERAGYHTLKAIELTADGGDRQVYENFLETIEAVLAGERDIPELVPLEQSDRLENDSEHEHHHH